MVVEDFFGIQGLDTLWEAFLRSADADVVKDAGDLLAQLHLRLAVPSDKQRVWDRSGAVVIVYCSVCALFCFFFGQFFVLFSSLQV